MGSNEKSEDDRYLKILMKPIMVCAKYKPMFGQKHKGGMDLAAFREMYQADPFYAWMGLDSPLMYAAHKAAGGMTSVYRQIGMGGQRLLQQVLQDNLGLDEKQVLWSYTVPTRESAKTKTLSLDGRIDLSHVKGAAPKRRVTDWLDLAKVSVKLPQTAQDLKGAVFEVRQGYKSKDSKRQHGDLDNIASAYLYDYLPVVLLLSTQIDSDVAERYTQRRCLLLRGTESGKSTDSTYVFCKDVVGYDLAGFFKRNSKEIRAQLDTILKSLLTAE